jgi:hypothetical protein
VALTYTAADVALGANPGWRFKAVCLWGIGALGRGTLPAADGFHCRGTNHLDVWRGAFVDWRMNVGEVARALRVQITFSGSAVGSKSVLGILTKTSLPAAAAVPMMPDNSVPLSRSHSLVVIQQYRKPPQPATSAGPGFSSS